MEVSAPDFWSATAAAAELGIDPSRVRRIAQRRGLGRKLGTVWVFTDADIAAMRVRVTGRPRATRP